MAITLRADKGSALTISELDGNFQEFLTISSGSVTQLKNSLGDVAFTATTHTADALSLGTTTSANTGCTLVGVAAGGVGTYGTAIGYSSYHTQEGVSIGYNADNTNSLAVSIGVNANADYSGTTVGYYADDNGWDYCVNIGGQTDSYGNYATAVGYSSYAYENGVAVGYDCGAQSKGIAIGRYCYTYYDSSQAYGYYAQARNSGEIVFSTYYTGSYNTNDAVKHLLMGYTPGANSNTLTYNNGVVTSTSGIGLAYSSVAAVTVSGFVIGKANGSAGTVVYKVTISAHRQGGSIILDNAFVDTIYNSIGGTTAISIAANTTLHQITITVTGTTGVNINWAAHLEGSRTLLL